MISYSARSCASVNGKIGIRIHCSTNFPSSPFDLLKNIEDTVVIGVTRPIGILPLTHTLTNESQSTSVDSRWKTHFTYLSELEQFLARRYSIEFSTVCCQSSSNGGEYIGMFEAVEVAIGAGVPVAIEVADVALVRGHLRPVSDTLRSARKEFARVGQNLKWAMGSTVVGIPIAALV